MIKETTLITGAAGFIGSHLCDFFLANGFHVIGVDNFITGNRTNLKTAFENPDFSFYERNLVGLDLEFFLGLGPIHNILHFASPASPPKYQANTLNTLRVNAEATFILLELARVNDARILVASTSEIYGDPLEHPQREEYNGNVSSIGPRSMYDEAKRYMEALVVGYRMEYPPTKTRIVRIFNTYGPRMDVEDGRAVPNFIDKAIKGEPLTIYGDGSQTRSFCYIEDLVDGIYKLLFSDYSEPVNIGNPVEISMDTLAEEIIRMVGSSSEIVKIGALKDDPQRRRPNISRAKEILNWQPKIDRHTGLSRTIEYFKNNKIS